MADWYRVEVEYKMRETVYLHADSLSEAKTLVKDTGKWEDNMNPHMVAGTIVAKSASKDEN